MNYDEWKQATPPQMDNDCEYCGEPCDGHFCDSNCERAYLSEN